MADSAVPAATAANSVALAAKLSELPLGLNYRKAQAIYNDVESTSLGGNDPKLQEAVAQGLALCETALRQVSEQSIFSQNELAEDVNTGDLRYLMLPFFRGELLTRVTDQSRRVELLTEALACLRGFLDDLERLQALSPEVLRSWHAAREGLGIDPATLRTLKIERFKANKQNKLRMEVLAGRLRRAGQTEEEEADGEEIEREHMQLLLAMCTHTALDSVRSCAARGRKERAPEPIHPSPRSIIELIGTAPASPPSSTAPQSPHPTPPTLHRPLRH